MKNSVLRKMLDALYSVKDRHHQHVDTLINKQRHRHLELEHKPKIKLMNTNHQIQCTTTYTPTKTVSVLCLLSAAAYRLICDAQYPKYSVAIHEARGDTEDLEIAHNLFHAYVLWNKFITSDICILEHHLTALCLSSTYTPTEDTTLFKCDDKSYTIHVTALVISIMATIKRLRRLGYPVCGQSRRLDKSVVTKNTITADMLSDCEV